MSKHIKAKRQNRAGSTNEATRKLWLAGLGAFSLAQKQGTRIVDTLVEEGEQFRARGNKYVNTVGRDVRRAADDVQKRVKGFVTPIRKRAVDTVRQFEGAVNERLGDFLGRFGVPSKSEVQELSHRVGTLNREIKTTSARKRPAAGARKRPVTAARKRAA
jgi:poly(hydroxyalkanoate) granule-associated protein